MVSSDRSMNTNVNANRVENDAYFSPEWVTQPLTKFHNLDFTNVWEPFYGTGNLVTGLATDTRYSSFITSDKYLYYPKAKRNPDVKKDFLETKPWLDETTLSDYLNNKNEYANDMLTHSTLWYKNRHYAIVSNPPYTNINQYIQKCLNDAQTLYEKRITDGNISVCLFMRNELDCAASRQHIFKSRFYTKKIVVTKRPYWDWPEKGVDTSAPRHNYSWYVWEFNDDTNEKLVPETRVLYWYENDIKGEN